MRAVVVGFLMLILASMPAFGQSKISIALFNLTPKSIDAIGVDGDLLFTMRQEMERSEAFQLMSRRQMEEGLYRIDGAQVSQTDLVVKYGSGLGVNFILTGTIDIVRSTIVVDFTLVDVVRGVEASSWRESFRTQGELVTKAPAIAQSLEQRVKDAARSQQQGDVDTLLTSFVAQSKGSVIDLSWETVNVGSVFYYNLYRGSAENGPFEFVASSTDPFYTDSGVNDAGTYYYRLDIVLDSGEQLNAGVIAKAAISGGSGNKDIAAPSILQSTGYANGVELAFVPAISNKQSPAGYQLYFRELGADWRKAVYIEESGKINYTLRFINELAPARTYEFALSTVMTDKQESVLSESVKIDSAPTPVVSVDNTVMTRKVALAWQPSANEYGIKVFRRKHNEEQWQQVAELAAGHGGKYLDKKNLEDGENYDYAVGVFDAVSETAKSNIVTQATKKLPAPQTLTATGGVKAVTLSWESVDDVDVTGYRIFRAEGDIGRDALLDKLADVKSAQVTQFVDGIDNRQPLKDGTQYNYVVVAVNEFGGVGEVSKTQTASTKPRPQQASALNVVTQEQAIAVSWPKAAESDVRSYVLMRRWNNESWQKVASLAADTLSYTDADLKPYAQTAYQLVVEDADGLQSDPSSPVSVLSPAVIRAQVVEDGLLRKAHIGWSAQRNVSGFKLHMRKADSGAWQSVATINDASATDYVHADSKMLADGQRYEYAVSAFDAAVETPKSNVVAISTMPAPEPPAAFTALGGKVKEMTLTWEPAQSPAVKGYKVYRQDNGKWELLETIKDRQTSQYSDKGSFFKKLEDGATYRYIITAFNPYDNEGPASMEAVGTTKPVPQPVTSLTASETAPTVTLSWQAGSEDDLDYYQLYRGSNCAGVRKYARTGSTRFVDSDIDGGKSYCYRVSAVDLDELEGSLSAPVQLTTAERPKG